MKKMIIGLAVGVAALGATVVPASAGSQGGVVGHCEDQDFPSYNDGEWDYCSQSIWDLVRNDQADTEFADDPAGTEFGLSDLILIAGMANTLDACGNGKPFYTLFAPSSAVLEAVLGSMDAEIADLQAAPDVVKAILADHLVNGSFSPDQLSLSKVLTARSGYRLKIQNIVSLYGSAYVDDYYVDGNQIIYGVFGCNGWVYTIQGFIDSTDYVTSEGTNALDTPQDGTPGGTNSLPNTL